MDETAPVPESVTISMLVAARRILSWHLAEDVVQDVLTRFYAAPDRFDPARGSLNAFLVTVTRRRAIDVLRSETARTRREQRHAALAVHGRTIEQIVTDHEQADRVLAAMQLLPAVEREAITLAYFHGLSYRAVAERLGIPEGTTKSRIRSGLARLQTLLEALDQER
ncbi:MAG: RNA polymerase sigma factor [Acidimicrobiales bacterium]